jgi:EAL domain-containing protein (putative c-di-GMP-specific phosphodiesterase class I)
MSISGGIVMAPEDAESFPKLMQNAKLAVRLVRSEAQSGFRFFTPRLTRIVQGRYRFEAELRDAVGNKEFKAVFQPKIDFQTGRITGAEALARWRRPNGKLISPATFIPVAEQAGLIDAIGMQILEAACEAARTWQLEGFDLTVAVNVSPSQFQRHDLTDSIMAVLRRTGLHPNRLELEITESMAVSDPARVAEFISPLRAMGTKLAIDDFGTGHSNLATLTQLPFDVFKIDRQFVSALETDKQAPAIVEMILAMAETLGLKTVAEGVETTKQAEFLRRRGCTMAQGFLYSPGLPEAAFLDFLRAWNPSATSQMQDFQERQAPRR